MKQENPVTKSVRSHLKCRTIAGERVSSSAPRARVLRFGVVGRVFAVVKDDFKAPILCRKLRKRRVQELPSLQVPVRDAVPVTDALDVSLHAADLVGAVLLVRRCQVEALPILRLISVQSGVAG